LSLEIIMNGSDCPVCKSRLSHPTPAPDTRTWTINCPRCDSYLLTFEAQMMLQEELNREPLRWAITSHAIRRMYSPGSAPHKVTQAWLQEVWANRRLPTPQEQADTFVQYLGTANVPSGNWVRCNPQQLTGLLGTADDPTRGETGGFVFVIKGLKNKGLIEEESYPDPRSPGTAGYRLTFEGWERFEQLRNSSRGEAASEKEEWITAASALALLGKNSAATICKRAHAGLIKARAERFIRDGRPADNVDIPVEFWWAKGEAALHQNWETGDFDTWIDQRIHLEAFGVTFRRFDIERSTPTPAVVTAGTLDEAKSRKSQGPEPTPARSAAMSLPVAVVLTAIEAETQAVLRHLTDRDRQRVSDTWFHTGRFAGWTIAVAEAGPGNASAATIATRALAYFNPEIAAFVGVAGGVKDVTLGDVVVATKVYAYESGKETPNGFFPRPEVQKSHHELEQRARVLRSDTMWHRRLDTTLWSDRKPRVYVDPIAAGEAVVAANAGRIATLLRKHYGDALAVEMEGRGFLEAAHIESGCRAVVVRGISDLLKGKAKTDKLGWQQRAADAAAAFFFEMLALESEFPPERARRVAQQTAAQPERGANPPPNPALKARAAFIPELERVFRRQVQILDRVVVNFSVTANELLGAHQAIRPGDTWESLRPLKPHLFPDAAVYRDLSASDAELLAEFYGAVNEVADLIHHWAETVALTEYNAWNVLMHKVQHSLRMAS
jgi:nucleoside phosphorylase